MMDGLTHGQGRCVWFSVALVCTLPLSTELTALPYLFMVSIYTRSIRPKATSLAAYLAVVENSKLGTQGFGLQLVEQVLKRETKEDRLTEQF